MESIQPVMMTIYQGNIYRKTQLDDESRVQKETENVEPTVINACSCTLPNIPNW